MSRKRKELPTLESFELTDIAAEGNALGRTESGMVVFVPFGAPGDIADIKIDKKKKKFCHRAYISYDKTFGHASDASLSAFRNMRRMPMAAYTIRTSVAMQATASGGCPRTYS